MMKPYSKVLLLLFTILVFGTGLPAKGHASPLFVMETQAGCLYSITSLPELLPAIQHGWEAKVSVAFETGYAFGQAAYTGRLQADIFGLDSSLPQADGNLYRAWQGMGLSLLAGMRFPAFNLPIVKWPVSVRIEAGGGLRATKYTGTGLVSANPALVLQAGLDIPLTKNMALGFAIPIELAWKSGGIALMFGLGAAFSYR
jgi:hypothetical protein